jgi:hypothetical protein
LPKGLCPTADTRKIVFSAHRYGLTVQHHLQHFAGDAGVDLDLAERLGLPVDAGRIGAYGPNVTSLRDFVRSSRQPL